MSLQIVTLVDKHLEDAAALSCARYRMLCEQVPLLPPRYGEVSTILPLLRDLVGQTRGVAAIHRGKLTGFLTAHLIPDLWGSPAVYSPEWANAADPGHSRRIYEAMYAHLSAHWAADRYFTHLISLLPHDRDGIEGWQWLGFGLIAADGVRDLQPVPAPATEVEVQRAGPQDAEQVKALTEALRQHMAAAPIFFPHTEEEIGHDEDWLGDPVNALWLAYHRGEAVACMGQGPASLDACTIIRDEGTTSIISAYTLEVVRGEGIATTLLNRCLDWARTQGYERCAVDWEPMNTLATRFWLRYFQPVSYALIRHVDERAVPTHREP